MSELSNVPNQPEGFFKPGVKPTAPNTQPHGPLPPDKHAPGEKASPYDYKPEFSMETHPPGTAPAGSSFKPNPIDHPGEQALNPNVERSHGKESVKTTAEQTLMGATSKDVYKGFGHPGSGQTSTEIRHDGQHKRKNPGRGLDAPLQTDPRLSQKPTAASGSHAEDSRP
ncbi:hypothetical protein ASPCAL06720 [Aspergillus calidoustus]|uniref:Uncharacterized protein n=1 Tax=Aspergillus calidoustus TaxID=454130 RepID=A0A0U5G0X1_ASPCI|nr:hypothetical protein ASPCAL06720 [Aspergillus calidoustus]